MWQQSYVTDATGGKVHTPRPKQYFTHAEVPASIELLWQLLGGQRACSDLPRASYDGLFSYGSQTGGSTTLLQSSTQLKIWNVKNKPKQNSKN